MLYPHQKVIGRSNLCPIYCEMPVHPLRKQMRLRDYDYASAGHYFVTICTELRDPVFGSIYQGRMYLNQLGRLVARHWHAIPDKQSGIELDEFVVMPDHLHGIIVIHPVGERDKQPSVRKNEEGAMNRLLGEEGTINRPLREDRTTVAEIVRRFKARSTQDAHVEGCVGKLWQRGYYDRIIRDEDELMNIRTYIKFNPVGCEQKRTR